MQYHMKWLTHSDIPMIMQLSTIVYKNEKETYPLNLKPSDNQENFSNIIQIFLVSDTYLGYDQRVVLGIFDDTDKLLIAIGVRKLLSIPAWTLSWTISIIKTFSFLPIWKNGLLFIIDEMEKNGYKEFFVINPTLKEKVYEKLMRFLRDRYYTFVEINIDKGNKTKHSLYWSIMGYQLYPYDINIRRYILIRKHNESVCKTYI